MQQKACGVEATKKAALRRGDRAALFSVRTAAAV
jgi:hypothetical protein